MWVIIVVDEKVRFIMKLNKWTLLAPKQRRIKGVHDWQVQFFPENAQDSIFSSFSGVSMHWFTKVANYLVQIAFANISPFPWNLAPLWGSFICSHREITELHTIGLHEKYLWKILGRVVVHWFHGKRKKLG